MIGDKTRHALVALLAALVLVIGGAVAASGQIGAVRGQVTSASPSDGSSTDGATDDPTDEQTNEEATEQESTDDESTDEESTDEEPTDDTSDKDSDDRQQGAAAAKEPCTLTSPPNRAATSGTDPALHPGWTTGRHFGWCRAATHGRPTTSDDGAVAKRPDTPARPGATERTKPHPGKRLAKGHGKRR